MAGERTFLRVPPDSTGKRVRMTHTAEIFYTNLNPASYAWDIGERYFTTFSDDAVYYIHVHGVHQITSTTGILEVHYQKSAKYNNIDPKIGANILDEDGVTVLATVQSFREVYINSNHILGYDNPEYGVDVDPTGSMNVRFAEGLPQLDAFGKLRVSGVSILGDYTFANNLLNDQFATTKFGITKGAATVFDDDLHAATLVTGVDGQTHTATANYGPNSIRIQMTTNTYHHYFPGLSQMAIMTVALGDEGKVGVMREWGYFDGEYDFDITNPSATNELTGGNGYFFRVTGTNGLEFVIRSSATGVVTERIMRKNSTIITSGGVVQSTTSDGWNGDPVDGTGDSGKDFDLRDDNIYWLDIQWLGAGRVRFGTYHKGQRIVIHEYYHDSNSGFPHSQTGSLPLRFCQHQMKDIAVTGSSNMKVWCGAIYSESGIETASLGSGRTEYFKALIDPANMNDVQGLNDAFGDRGITTKTGITSSGTTLTVPNLTGIKPGWIIQDSDGLLAADTQVTDIINSTTIQISSAPDSDFSGVENINFNMPLNDEYYLIGILAPVPELKGVNHPNRTLYLPRSARAWAYHEDGSEAFLSVQVYVNPVISGVNRVSNLYDTTEAAALGVDPVFTPVEPNDPGNAVMAYGKAGIDSVNLFRNSGIHALVTYSGGYGGQEDLSGAFTSLSSSFKNIADDGGNNRCPILKIIQSPSAGKATVIQINTPPTGISYSLHREGNAIQFEQIPGLIGTDPTYGINDGGATGGAGEIFYLRMIDNDKAELYTDKNFQTPWDTSALDNSTNGNSLTWPGLTGGDVNGGGFILSGYGPETYFCVFAKPQGPSKADSPFYDPSKGKIEVNFALYWNEIRH
jgi:hypothetical protein